MFDGSCVFIDSATGFIHLVLQVNLNMHKTLNAIHEFEQVCRNHGVIPQLYHSDNASVFTSEGVAEKLKRFAQIITFAGADAHHHNGMAERAIGVETLVDYFDSAFHSSSDHSIPVTIRDANDSNGSLVTHSIASK
jgi:hypothetical protein